MNEPTRLPSRRTLLLVGIPAVVGLAALITWWIWPTGPAGLSALRDRDPNGATACGVVVDYINGDWKGNKGEASGAAGTPAAESTTPAIRTAAIDITQGTGIHTAPIWLANMYVLWDACKAAGVDMPDRTGVDLAPHPVES